MATKKEKETNTSVLTYEEYCSILSLAQTIRNENNNELEKMVTPKEKVQLWESLLEKYQIPNSTSKEKEQSLLLKVNVFIPNTEQFIIDYKTKYDKNVRLISEEYQLPAPWSIAKVAEISNYERYFIRFQEEKKEEAPKKITKKRTSSKKTTSKKETSSQPKEAETLKQETTPPSEKTTIENKKLVQQFDFMQGYCSTLLATNEKIAKEKEALRKYANELSILVNRLKEENGILQQKISEMTPQTVSQENSMEYQLRQKIKQLEWTNQELNTALAEQQKKSFTYRNRAIVAEAKLEQAQSSMNGFAKQVAQLDVYPFQNDFKSK